MGRRRRLLIELLSTCAACGLSVVMANGQASQPATEPVTADELPAAVRSALATIQDFAFNFDSAGFYAVVEHVKTSALPPGHTRPAAEIRDWRVFLERPASFRGEPITIEGTVGRSRSYQIPQRPQLGTLWQLELHGSGQPLACTLILTTPADDIPLNATIRATGYFVMIRQYYDARNRAHPAAVIVAPGPTLISQTGPPAGQSGSARWLGLIAAVLVAMVVAWLLLRRTVRSAPRDLLAIQASRSAPLHLADELGEWAAKDQPSPSGGDSSAQADQPS